MTNYVTPDEVRKDMFDETVITDELLNSDEYIPLAQSEVILTLSKKNISVEELEDTQKLFLKFAILGNVRNKVCKYLSIKSMDDFQQVDKADIKFKLNSSPSKWEQLAQAQMVEYLDYIDKIATLSTSSSKMITSMIVRW